MKIRSESSRQPSASRRLHRARFEGDLGLDLHAALIATVKRNAWYPLTTLEAAA